MFWWIALVVAALGGKTHKDKGGASGTLSRTTATPPPPPEPPPSRAPKTTSKEAFAQNFHPVYIKSTKSTFKWAFCVDEIMEDATAAGGAQTIASILAWIGTFTGLNALTSIVCLKFSWKLKKYTTRATAESDAKSYWRLAIKMPIRRDDLPEMPLPKRSGYYRAWKAIEPATMYTKEDYSVYFPDIRGGEWTVMASTEAIRTALREDKLDLSILAKAQYANGRWGYTTRGKAREIYR